MLQYLYCNRFDMRQSPEGFVSQRRKLRPPPAAAAARRRATAGAEMPTARIGGESDHAEEL